MRSRGWCLAIAVAALGVSATAQQRGPAGEPPARQRARPAPPIRVYIRGGLKTHAEGQHDYPQYLADWSKVLTERGAIVDGGCTSRPPRELAATDVIVMYKGDAGTMSIEEKATLENFLRRGGGLVSFHDALCGPDPEYSSTIVGGAKKHGEVNYTLEADVPYTIVDKAHPIMQGDDGLHDQGRGVLPHDVVEDAGDPRAGDGDDGGDAERRKGTRAKSCRRCGPTRGRCAGARRSRIARSSGCRGTTTRTSPIRGSSRCCCAASRGRPSVRSTR